MIDFDFCFESPPIQEREGVVLKSEIKKILEVGQTAIFKFSKESPFSFNKLKYLNFINSRIKYYIKYLNINQNPEYQVVRWIHNTFVEVDLNKVPLKNREMWFSINNILLKMREDIVNVYEFVTNSKLVIEDKVDFKW